jgi:DeoR/GlpR family transcriptional regulator of sugar metabolism
VLLDAGSTVGALAHELRGLQDLTVVTTSLTVVAELAGSAVTVVCLGGTLRPLSQAFIGPLAEAALERLSFDRIFLGADGVSARDGICEAELEQTRLKELMARRSGQIYVLAHAEKLERRPFHAWAKLPEKWTLVTDDAADPVLVAGFTESGVDVHLAEDRALARL